MPKVFISYSRTESALAGAVSAALGTYGIQTWLDVADVPPGYPIRRAIEDGIRTSDILLVLVSPRALESRWVGLELNTAAAYQLSNIGVKVLPVLLDGTSADKLPKHLRAINCLDAAAGVEEIVRGVLRVFDDQPVRVFLAPERGRYNSDYYRYLQKRIREATQEVWITGNGFNCSDSNPEGKQRAAEMIHALEDRLRNHVRVFRVQTGPSIDPRWAAELLGLLQEFPSLMELWRLQEQEQHMPVSLTAIDPRSSATSVAEIMLSDKREEDPQGDYTSLATFVRRDPLTTQIVCSRIRDLTRASGAYRVYPTGPDAHSHLIGNVYYFAYGSNMNADQMEFRSDGFAERLEVGYLVDHKLAFNQASDRYQDGTVANIVASPRSQVYGIVWKLPWSAIVALDEAEGPELYERRSFIVHGLSGRKFPCWIYVGRVPCQKAPSPAYLARLRDAATQAELPRSYIDALGK